MNPILIFNPYNSYKNTPIKANIRPNTCMSNKLGFYEIKTENLKANFMPLLGRNTNYAYKIRFGSKVDNIITSKKTFLQIKEIIPVELPKPLSEKTTRKFFDKFRDPKTSDSIKEFIKKEIMEHNERLVMNKIKQFKPSSGFEMKDYFSIAQIGLSKAVDSYDPNKLGKKSGKPAKFGTYAGTCIENEINMALRANKKVNEELSLDNEITLKDGTTCNLLDRMPGGKNAEAIIIRKEEIQKAKDLLAKIQDYIDKNLPNKYQKVYKLRFIEQKTQREAAEIIGISNSYVSRIEDNLKKKLTKFKEEYK